MPVINSAQWARYKKAINIDAAGSFNKKIITWKPLLSNISLYGEDLGTEQYGTINLECLIYYNAFRLWPINQGTEVGTIDKESLAAIFNIKYLKTLGYTDTHDNFIFKPDLDYFIIDGQRYEASGDTKVSQASDEELLLYIIMKRIPVKTSESKY